MSLWYRTVFAGEGAECSVCGVEDLFLDHQVVEVVKCHHVFHPHCLLASIELGLSDSCPNCGGYISTDDVRGWTLSQEALDQRREYARMEIDWLNLHRATNWYVVSKLNGHDK